MLRSRHLLAFSLALLLEVFTTGVQAQTGWSTTLAGRQTVVKPQSLLLIPVPREPVWLLNAAARQDPDFARLLAKKRAYSAFCNELMSVANGWAVYASWVDVEKGPEGSEKIAPGLVTTNPQMLMALATRARQYAMKEPLLPDLDAAISGLAQLVEPVPAVMNEANAYYDRKDYLDDDFKGGLAYHKELVKIVPPLLAARDVVMKQIAVLGAQLDTKEIEMIEASNGKKYLWHSRRVLALAGRLVPFLDWKPEKARSEELKAAVAEFAGAVRAFDEYRASPRAEHASGGSLYLLPRVREWRAGSDDDQAIWSVVNEYNSMVGQLEYGPDGMDMARDWPPLAGREEVR
jgi:hypothetical protein